MANNVKINNKNYIIPNLEFGHYIHMEEQGMSLIDAFRKNQIMLLTMGFVSVVVGCDKEEAERLINQHILGGGNLITITEAMYKAFADSDFFSKMLQTEEQKKQTKKTNQEEKAE